MLNVNPTKNTPCWHKNGEKSVVKVFEASFWTVANRFFMFFVFFSFRDESQMAMLLWRNGGRNARQSGL